MAVIRKNPNLPDYFSEVPGVRASCPLATIPSIVAQYEEPRVLSFPDLKLEIDFGFWSSLETSTVPAFKKLVTAPSLDADRAMDAQDQAKSIAKTDIAGTVAAELSRHMTSILDQILPVYRHFDSVLDRGHVTGRASVCR